MDLGNFYTGFGILLVYFTLIWQNSRGKCLEAIKSSRITIEKKITTASIEKIDGEKDKIKGCLFNPLTITIDIISLAGLIAFYIIIKENLDKVEFSVEIIVLFSITLMHLVISFDLWRLNINLLANLARLKSSK